MGVGLLCGGDLEGGKEGGGGKGGGGGGGGGEGDTLLLYVEALPAAGEDCARTISFI
jgi:hypothetical protein